MSGVRIREMSGGDLDAARAIASDLKDAPHWPRSAYEVVMDPVARPERVALVAEDEERAVCGFAVAALVSDTEAELESIAVEEKRQRQGIARSLFRELSMRMCERGIEDVLLEVRESNSAAQAFYRAEGFLISGRRPAYYSNPPDDALVMRKRLPGAKRP
ncbi:MAG TPA: ribosomal protein S18-alanine N-acetyltransferase [Terracidiphilus sp.]|nr:ribosomal protein S18-alanine N-acetyltransferase [Terracidiphilus sp.]